MKNRIPFLSLVAVIPSRRNVRSATGRTRPQKNWETDTRISPDVRFSAAWMALLIRSGSISFNSFRRCMRAMIHSLSLPSARGAAAPRAAAASAESSPAAASAPSPAAEGDVEQDPEDGEHQGGMGDEQKKKQDYADDD